MGGAYIMSMRLLSLQEIGLSYPLWGLESRRAGHRMPPPDRLPPNHSRQR